MKLAQYLPAPVRKGIYVALGVVVAVEAIWDLVPSGIETKALATATVLGFGLASSQARDPGA